MLTVSADQVTRQADGSWLITMDPAATSEVCSVCNGHDIDSSGDVSSSCYACYGGAVDVPRPELVALLQPCPACRGKGTVRRQRVGHGRRIDWAQRRTVPTIVGETRPCPDCVNGGRLVFDLQWPCPHCNDCYEDNCEECWRCCPDGDVSVRVYLDPEHGIKRDGDRFTVRAVEVET